MLETARFFINVLFLLFKYFGSLKLLATFTCCLRLIGNELTNTLLGESELGPNYIIIICDYFKMAKVILITGFFVYIYTKQSK